MARTIRFPSEAELPPGAVRDFAELLFWLWCKAHRPALRKISATIESSDRKGTGSTETIRRMLRGTSVPQWEIVESVYLALCDLADLKPSDRVYWDDEDEESRTIRSLVETPGTRL